MIGLLFLGTSAQAQLLHSYAFGGADPLADGTGNSHLINQGVVSFGDEAGLTFASFDGSTAHLVVDQTAGPFELGGYTVSFWFRLDTLSQSNWSGLFSAGTGGSGQSFHIDTHSGWLRFITGIFGQTVNLAPTADLGAGEWHLLTLTQDTIWINGVSVPYVSGYLLPALKDFALGINRKRNQSIEGEIADVRIYGSLTQWDAIMQDDAYIAGPYGLFQPARGTVIMISSADRGFPVIGSLGL